MENRLIIVLLIAFVMGSAIHVVSSLSFDVPVPCAETANCTNDSRLPKGTVCKSGWCVSPDEAPNSKNSSSQISPTLQASSPTHSSSKAANPVGRTFETDDRSCSAPCNPPFEFCNTTRKQCDCKEGYVMASQIRQCLIVATTLGSNCTENQQCQKKMANTACSDEQCICSIGFHAVGNECWKSSGIGDICSSDKECSHVQGAECSDQKTSRCICRMGTTVNSIGNECLPLADAMLSHCIDKSQCSKKFGYSDCIDQKCQCQKNDHFNKTLSQCVSHPSLGGNCSEDYECDQGEDRDMPRTQLCLNNICSCNTSFVQNGDFCIAGAASLVPGLLSILSAILLFSRW